jgi:hypothetical protein
VYARARNGDTNYAVYCDGGLVYNQDKLLNVGQAAFGSVVSQSSSAIASRKNGNSIEFGAPDKDGFGSNIGATKETGLPFLAFCAETEAEGDTFRTRGKMAVVISSDLAGSLVFSRLTDATATDQAPTESARFDETGRLVLQESPILPSKTPKSANAVGTAGEVSWDADFIYVCVATDTWKRSPLSTW